MFKRILFLPTVFFLVLAVSLWTIPTASAFWNDPLNPGTPGQTPLPGSAIPKFIDPLPLLGTIETVVAPGAALTNIYMHEFLANILPTTGLAPFVPPGGWPATAPNGGTWVWGYRTTTPAPTTPVSTYTGPVFVVDRGTPTEIKFWNTLPANAWSSNVLAWKYSTDQTMHWADPLGAEVNDCADKVAKGGFPALVQNGPGSTFPPFGDPCSKNYGEGLTAAPIPAVVHLHGGEVPPELDGGPDAWFTSTGLKGHGFHSKDGASATNYAIYRYPNGMEAAPIWFHDHALGITRLNVYAGLAGAYIIRDLDITPVAYGGNCNPAANAPPPNRCLPGDLGDVTKIIPLVIQDRMFDTNGQLFFPADSAGGLLWTTNPEHPYWVPEFVGDTIVVNGKTWPFLQVAPNKYRFLFVNGSNARTYELFLPTPAGNLPFWVISTDGGYLNNPVPVTKLVIMPGERYDVIMDFSAILPGTNLILKNTGRTPYPKGGPPNGATVGQIVQFRVGGTPVGVTPVTYNPAAAGATIRSNTAALNLPPAIVRLPGTPGGLALPVTPGPTQTVQLVRQLTLNEVMGLPKTVTDPVSGTPLTAYPGGPLEILLNNTKLSGKRLVAATGTNVPGIPGTAGVALDPIPDSQPVSGVSGTGTIYYTELPKEGDTEVWEIINITADAHPIHLHLVQFQIIDRQNFNVGNYTKAYAAAFGGIVAEAFGPPYNYSNSNNPDFCATLNCDGTTGKPPKPTTVGGNPNIRKLTNQGAPLYLQGKPSPPLPQEAGWKDTVVSYPGQVLRLAVRWAPMDLPNNTLPANAFFPFSPNGHGYVWHCHIIDHEDNEMMRPTQVQPLGATRTYKKCGTTGADPVDCY